MMDRRLGTHFAADPEVSNSFTRSKGADSWAGKLASVPDGARVISVNLPGKFLEAKQEIYPSGNLQSDQDAIEKMIGQVAFKKDSELLGRFISRARNTSLESGLQAAKDLIAGKPVSKDLLITSRDLSSVDDFIGNFGAHVHDISDQKRAVQLARDEWKSQGYKGIKYINTSPMEMEHAKNPTSYIVFDPNKDAKLRYSK
jgi:hypothetical protein